MSWTTQQESILRCVLLAVFLVDISSNKITEGHCCFFTQKILSIWRVLILLHVEFADNCIIGVSLQIYHKSSKNKTQLNIGERIAKPSWLFEYFCDLKSRLDILLDNQMDETLNVWYIYGQQNILINNEILWNIVSIHSYLSIIIIYDCCT